jgi:hypothetical protein
MMPPIPGYTRPIVPLDRAGVAVSGNFFRILYRRRSISSTGTIDDHWRRMMVAARLASAHV